MRKITSLLLWGLIMVGCGGGEQESRYLKRVWQSRGEALAVPESVVHDQKRHLLYVSNVNSQTSGNPWTDNHGFISKLDEKGKVLAREWVKGLQAPKGLALWGERLYVADLDRVVVIDALSGKILKQFNAPQGVNRLNDIAVDPKKGLLYLSNSSNKELYQVNAQGKFTLFYPKEHHPKAEQNGLYVDQNQLIMQGAVGYLKSLALDGNQTIKVISESINIPIDGITKYRDQGYLVSAWGGEIHFINNQGEDQLLLESKPMRSADIFYSESLDLLLVPDFDRHIVAYAVRL